MKGHEVTLIADEDEPGRKCMRGLAAHLQKLGANVQLLCPLGDSGRDIADVINDASEDDSRGAMAALDYINSIQPEAVTLDSKPPVKTELFSYSTIKSKATRWTVRGWIPKSAITLLAGQAGFGKTMLALDWAARITRGIAFPDDAKVERGSAVIWTGEDDMNRTIRPRLEAVGADLDHVFGVDTTYVGEEQMSFDPAQHLGALSDAIRKHGGVRLVVIDPALAIVGDVRDEYSATTIRAALGPVQKLAAELDVSVLVVTHFLKRHNAASSSPLDRVIGSQAWAAVARCVLAVDYYSEQRVLAKAKLNLGSDNGALSYEIQPATVYADDGTAIPTARVVYSGTFDGNATTLFTDTGGEKRRNRDSERREFILEVLKDGPMRWEDISKEGKDDEGFSTTMLRETRDKLQKESLITKSREKIPTGNGKKKMAIRWKLTAAGKKAVSAEKRC